METNLATIRRVLKIDPIHGANNIEVATVDGYKTVVKKGSFAEGDLCVFIEIDTVLPDTPWNFLKPGHRLKTCRLRGQVSQGLALSTSLVAPDSRHLGVDVTEELKVTKYVSPAPDGTLGGQIKGSFPSRIISKTDELNAQSYLKLFQQIVSGPHVITVKYDGSSMTVWNDDLTDLRVCSRNLELKEDASNAFWRIARKLPRLPTGLVFQGELCGPGIQSNPLTLTENRLFVFNVKVIDPSHKEMQSAGWDGYLPHHHVQRICHSLGLEPVTTLDSIAAPSLDKYLELANSVTYPNGKPAEGIVIRPTQPTYDDRSGRLLSVKVLSARYDESK